MHTLTMELDALALGAARSKPGFFARLIEAREKSAMRRTLAYLGSQSDARLAGLGFGVEDISALRAGELRLPAATTI